MTGNESIVDTAWQNAEDAWIGAEAQHLAEIKRARKRRYSA